MEVKELTLAEIRETILDMKSEALAKRTRAKRMKSDGQHTRAFALISEAIILEHWVARLENALTIG